MKTIGLIEEPGPDEQSNWPGTAKQAVPDMLEFRCNIWRFKLLPDVESNDPVLTGHFCVELVEPNTAPRYGWNFVLDALSLSF
jgi:hypothetical protein